jgi:FkbM family methyltransferase
MIKRHCPLAIIFCCIVLRLTAHFQPSIASIIPAAPVPSSIDAAKNVINPSSEATDIQSDELKKWIGMDFFMEQDKLFFQKGTIFREGSISSFGKSAHRVLGVSDIEFILPRNDAVISDQIRLFGSWELQFILPMLSLLQRHITDTQSKEAIFIDVGANIGSWTLPFAKYVGLEGYVYAIEAQQQLVKYLSASAVLNSFDNIIINNAILSNHSSVGTHLFNLESESGGKINHGEYSIDLLKSKTSRQASENLFKANSLRSSVREVTLDDLYFKEKAFGCPTMIKMDIEYHEVIALVGARRLLEECRPILFIEALCHLQLKTIFTILDKAGYSMAYIVVDAREYWTQPIEYHDQIDPIDMIFGESNLVAIPKETAGAIFEGSLSSDFYGKLYPVDPTNIKSGELDIEYLNIEVCAFIYTVGYHDNDKSRPIRWMNELGDLYPNLEKEQFCKVLRHHENCGFEGGPQNITLDPFFFDYWKKIEREEES